MGYLISLGEEYSTWEAVVSVLPAEQQTLVEVMRRAADHSIVERDEADNSAHALIAKLEREGYVMQKKQKTEGAFAASGYSHGHGCSVCGKTGHTKDECFAPGGGLHHLNPQQRFEWLQKRRTQRWQQYQKQQQAQQQQPEQKATESAAIAQQQPDNAGLVAALEEKVAEQQRL